MLYSRYSNQELLKEMDKHVFGHTEAKKALIRMVNRSRIRHKEEFLEGIEPSIPTSKLLLIGGSGTGKTYLVQTLAKLLNFPLIVVDGSDFNPSSSRSGMTPDKLKRVVRAYISNYLENAPEFIHSKEGAQSQLVIFMDEIDKLAKEVHNESSWNASAQASLLTLIESDSDFRGVSWVFAGAFHDLTKNPIDAPTKHSIGFTKHDTTDSKKGSGISDEALINYGLIPELVGRLNEIIELDVFTKEHYVKILKTQLLPQKAQEMKSFNISSKSIMKEQEFDGIIEKAIKSNQGVRYLIRELNRRTADLEFNYEKRPKRGRQSREAYELNEFLQTLFRGN